MRQKLQGYTIYIYTYNYGVYCVVCLTSKHFHFFNVF